MGAFEVKTDGLVVRVGVFELVKQSEQFRDRYAASRPFVCFENSGNAAGIGWANGDVNQSSFERGDFDLLTCRRFCSFDINPTRMFSVEDGFAERELIEVAAEDLTQGFDTSGSPGGEVGEGAGFDFAVVPEGLAEEDGWRRVTIGDGGNIHAYLIQ